jgi:hypothetical protein
MMFAWLEPVPRPMLQTVSYVFGFVIRKKQGITSRPRLGK